ncbi:MAG: CBS domain-containing protein [Anaerolineae bacterium]|nr:CBS domain-containing protein [Anaerolineae bacterium]
MLVKDYMTRHPIMIGPEKRVIEAQQMMIENKVRHLPVVGDGKKLLGLVNRERLNIPPDKLGSLEVWEITRYLSDLTVDKVMLKAKELQVIGPDATLEEAAELMKQHKLNGLTVVEDGMVVGIITQTDLFVELQELLGATDPGWRVMMRIPARKGEYAKLTTAISDKGWSIMAMGSVRTPKDPAHWDMILKVTDCTKDELMALLESIEDHQVVDVRETTVYSS